VRILLESLRAAVLDLLRRPLGALLATAAMTVAMCLLALFLALGTGARGLYERWSGQAALELFLSREAPADAVERLAEELRGSPGVARVEVIDPERALAEFEEAFPDLGDVAAVLGENPFGGSIRVVPSRADEATVEALARRGKESGIVDSVRWDREWIGALARIGRLLGGFLAIGALVLVGAALVTVGAVVRLALDDKRDEVALLRLCGAPLSFVLLPLLLEGALLGALGAGIGLLLARIVRVAVLEETVGTPLEGILHLLLGPGVPAPWIGGLFVAGVLAGVLAAALSAGRAALR